MATSLKRVFDYKLAFDSLCDSNGMVRLETLTARWPLNLDSGSKVPLDCVKHWKNCADKDGYLDWNSFSTALQSAIQEDSSRLAHASKPDMPRSKAEQRLASLRLKGAAGQSSSPPLGKVTAADIESFLSDCSRDVLNKALKKMRKEVYKGQMSLHRGASNPKNKPVDQPPVDTEEKKSHPASGDSKGGGITSKEREELTYGLEMMERTRRWYKERLRLLASEESQDSSRSKKVKAEELLKVLEKGSSTKSEILSRLKVINTHLESLSSSAPSLTAEQKSKLTAQLSKLRENRPEKSQKKPTHLPVGPPPAHVGEAVVEFSPVESQHSPTIVIETPTMPTFPVRTSDKMSRQSKTLPKRASSTTEVHRLGVTSSEKSLGYQHERTQPRYASSQNIHSTHTTHRDRDRDSKPPRAPKRSSSFTSPTRNKAEQPLDLTSSVTDYPVHRKPQQYPLRSTNSMQELQPGYQASGTGRSSRQTGQLSKSSSVRNVSSGSHGSSRLSANGPSLIQQQVYTTGMSYSTQAIPSRTANKHRSYHGDGSSQRHARNQVADQPHTQTQRLGDNIQSIV